MLERKIQDTCTSQLSSVSSHPFNQANGGDQSPTLRIELKTKTDTETRKSYLQLTQGL